jgi:hypothetical protein
VRVSRRPRSPRRRVPNRRTGHQREPCAPRRPGWLPTWSLAGNRSPRWPTPA